MPKLNIIIDAKTKKTLLEQLESLNIHGGAVYPDLTHMSNYIRNRYLFDNSKLTFVNITAKKGRITKKTTKDITTIQTKPKPIVKLVNDFDETKFWNKANEKKAEVYANKQKLDFPKFKTILNDYYFKDRLEHDSIRDAITENIGLIEKVKIAKELVQEVKLFANNLKK